jgi:hypothetical protein
MLNRLPTGDQAGITDRAGVALLQQLIGFFNQAFDRLTRFEMP